MVFGFVNRRREQDGGEEPVKDQEKAAELKDFAADGVHSGLLSGNAPGEKVFFPSPELEEQEMPGGFRDFHQRVVLVCGNDGHGGRELMLMLFVYRDFDNVGIFHSGHW